MQVKNLVSAVLILTVSSFFIFNCAGTKNEDDFDDFDSASQEQQDLDDIEALLGISSDKSEQPRNTNTDGEKLDLLESDDLTSKTSNSASMAAAMQQNADTEQLEKTKAENTRLKNQLKQKDRKIAELNALVDEQDSELQRTQSPGSMPSFNSSIGTVSSEEYKMRYDEARAAFEARQYENAIQYFESLLASSSTHSLADNAQYWIGESHFALRQYDAAIMDFEKVLTFPRSNKKEDAQYKLGYCYLKKGNRDKAAEEFQRLQENFPNSRLNSKAQNLLSR